MSKPKLIDYFRSTSHHLRQAISDEGHAMPLYRAIVFSGAAPLLQKPWPERPYTSDPITGEDIAGGVFRFAGRTLSFTHVNEAWTKPTPSQNFAQALHGFDWLQDLAAFEDNEEISMLAKAHVDTWIKEYGTWNRFAWNKRITAERCLAWLGAARMLFGGDAIATSARLASLGRQLRHLKSVIKVCEPGATRLWISIALTTAGTCLFGMKDLQKTGLDLLQNELEIQVLGDGGHISRNPEISMRLLLELDALGALLEQHENGAPPFIRRTMDRLEPFVRFSTMANGELAPFNGAGQGDPLAIRRVLEPNLTSEKPFLVAPHSRYHRLQTKNTTLLMDCGGAPKQPFTKEAHAGYLSFVFGTKTGNLITNCGSPKGLGKKWLSPSRTSAAHSTLIIDDASSACILTKGLRAKLLGHILFDREEAVRPRRTEDDDGVCLTATTLEYVSRYGLQHNRRLYLNKLGTDLRGEDVLERPIDLAKTTDLQPIPFCIRFHLHPDVRASLSRNQSSVLLLLSKGEGWRFRTDGHQLKLEPSVYLASGMPPRSSQQIVIEGAADPNGIGQETNNRVRWSLRRINTHS